MSFGSTEFRHATLLEQATIQCLAAIVASKERTFSSEAGWRPLEMANMALEAAEALAELVEQRVQAKISQSEL